MCEAGNKKKSSGYFRLVPLVFVPAHSTSSFLPFSSIFALRVSYLIFFFLLVFFCTALFFRSPQHYFFIFSSLALSFRSFSPTTRREVSPQHLINLPFGFTRLVPNLPFHPGCVHTTILSRSYLHYLSDLISPFPPRVIKPHPGRNCPHHSHAPSLCLLFPHLPFQFCQCPCPVSEVRFLRIQPKF